eukprot:6607644-Alexandrium_andersonii.AAC.1
MSASLVGSEMGIRDRAEPRGNPGGTQGDPRGNPGGTQGEPRGGTQGGNPRGTQGEPRGNPGGTQGGTCLLYTSPSPRD